MLQLSSTRLRANADSCSGVLVSVKPQAPCAAKAQPASAKASWPVPDRSVRGGTGAVGEDPCWAGAQGTVLPVEGMQSPIVLQSKQWLERSTLRELGSDHRSVGAEPYIAGFPLAAAEHHARQYRSSRDLRHVSDVARGRRPLEQAVRAKATMPMIEPRFMPALRGPRLR